MKSESLNRNIINKDIPGEEILDFSQPKMILKSQLNIIGARRIEIDEEMRIDLISSYYYGTTEYIDIILKANNIKNPFSIAEGQILRIPDKESAEQFMKNIKRISNKPRTQFTDIKRMNEKDKNRKKFLEELSKNKINGSSQNLPPNMLKSDQTAKEKRHDRIILGSNLRTNNRNR